MNNRKLLPAFIRKADELLLRNKPEIWSTRIHLLAWYSLLFVLALGALCYINYTDARLSSNVGFWVGFIIIIAILALITWLIYLLRFNVFKRFGLTDAKSRLLIFLLYFIACGLIAFYTFVPLLVETWRAEKQFNLPELTTDINKINLDIAELEINNLPKFWWRDTLHVVREKPADAAQFYSSDDKETYTDSNIKYNNYPVTKAELDTYLLSDSIRRLNDLIYIDYSPPNLRFVNADSYNDSLHGELSSLEIYKTAKHRASHANRASTARELQKLLNKYYRLENNILSRYNTNNDEIDKKYKLADIRTGIHNINDKLNRFSGFRSSVLFRVWFYTSFIIALLVFIFRHSVTKTFFLSLLTAVILYILSSLISAFSGLSEPTFYLWFFGYFIVFTFLSIQSFYSKTRGAIQGIAINLWVALLPFLPLLTVYSFYSFRQSRDLVKHMITTDYAAIHRNLLIAEFAGPVLFCILIVLFINHLYVQWYSLPEE